jgi:quinol monooxygenase YgiN
MPKIHCVGHLKAKAGKERDLENLLQEIVDAIEARDPGTVAFGFFHGDEPDTYLAVEVYEDSDAALGHLQNVGPLLAKLGDVIDGAGGEPLQVFGDPSDALKEQYAAFGAVYRPALRSL